MASVEHRKPSIEFIHSFYSGERNLFSRMASSLEIDGDLALRIISYWLWLEENINKDVICCILSLSDDGLKRISSLGEQILTNAGRSDSSIAQKALSGVEYFLNAVCTKAIDDLKEKKEHEKAKKVLQELDLQEFLCKPDPLLVKSYLSSGDGAGSSSSACAGMHIPSNNGFLSSIPETSSKVCTSKTGSYSGGDSREAGSLVQPHNDCAQNSSQLSALAKAYIPSRASHITSHPMMIPVNNTLAPPMEHMIESGAIVPALSAQSGAAVPLLPPLPLQSSTIVPQLPAFPLQSGAIVQHPPTLVPQSVPHVFSYAQQHGAMLPHMPALVPQSGVFVQQIPHMPAVSPQNGAVLHIPTHPAQNSVIVPQIPDFSPHNGAIGAHAPIISPHIGTVASSQNGTYVFQSPPGAPAMFINAQNIPQPAPHVVPPRRLHPDERTLFVTFSNGSPLTEEELLEFFATRYSINVESIFIEEPETLRTPQFAHVTFFSPESVEYILNGQAKVKFRTNGKHLWARRFIPRRRRRWGQNPN